MDTTNQTMERGKKRGGKTLPDTDEIIRLAKRKKEKRA
jgi:hypothetical protein